MVLESIQARQESRAGERAGIVYSQPSFTDFLSFFDEGKLMMEGGGVAKGSRSQQAEGRVDPVTWVPVIIVWR